MPKLKVAEEFELHTRDRFTKVNCNISIDIDGKELPNMGIVGEALERCIELVQQHITESYAKVPERVS